VKIVFTFTFPLKNNPLLSGFCFFIKPYMFFFNFKQKSLPLGARGEKSAEAYLRKIGYKIIKTNFSNTQGRRIGEIDIIAKDGNELVFLEIKTRTFSSLENIPLPEESITPAKLHKLNKIASFYIAENRLFGVPYRFDAITLTANTQKGRAALRHLKNIFI
jgi:putative endonuclease